MKLNEILQLDCRKKENKLELREALTHLPFFKETNVYFDIDDIEDALWKMCRKYPVTLSYIMPGPSDERYYSFMLKRTDTNEHIKTIYAYSVFEGMSKATLYIYGYIQNVLKKGGTK